MNPKVIDFSSDFGGKIPDSFKTNNTIGESWTAIPSPNFSSSSAQVDLFQNNNSDLFNSEASEGSVIPDLAYNSLSGIALGTINTGMGNSIISTQTSEAMHGQGPLRSAYNAAATAEHTASNEETAVSAASGAMAVGGLFGPEGLAIGAGVGLGIDALTAAGAFDPASSTMMSTTGQQVAADNF